MDPDSEGGLDGGPGTAMQVTWLGLSLGVTGEAHTPSLPRLGTLSHLSHLHRNSGHAGVDSLRHVW